MDHLQLGLGLSTIHSPCLSSESISSDNCDLMKKRTFKDSFDHDHVHFTTLPLFTMSGKTDPNGEDDHDYKELDKNSSTIYNDGDGNDDESIIGWPPINVLREKFCSGALMRNNNVCRSSSGSNGGADNFLAGKSKSTRLKVKMEGEAIGRKVDLSLHHSYNTLAHTLLDMFGKDDEDHMKHYELTYQDIDGDWLLAGDVPWSTFVETARRLKLIRSNF